ncbi:hypothetical protein C8R47DRAFT_192051 [Mycena vitilis]|nr:hypothetical protein C8R47DRAFT_192051 [Mycena vitilis]
MNSEWLERPRGSRAVVQALRNDSVGRSGPISSPSANRWYKDEPQGASPSQSCAHTPMVSENKDCAKDETQKEDGPPVKTRQLGVYRVLTEETPALSLREEWKKATKGFPTLLRLTRDVYASSPWLFCLFQLTQIWYWGIENTLYLHLTNRLLTTIETGLKNGKPDGPAIFQAAALSMVCVVFTGLVNRGKSSLEARLTDKIGQIFQNYILRSKLTTDLTGVQGILRPDQE